jgi:hypothetical protein
MLCIDVVVASRHIDDKNLWKHVVNLDRLAWEEQSSLKKINKQVDDQEFVRRIYLDITGKIPTYQQLTEFLKSKEINKRGKLIDELLDAPGYVSNFSNFWNDLLRNPYGNVTPEADFHKEFSRYIERVLAENRPYNEIVFDMIMSEGTLQQNQAAGFWMVDSQTSTHDTLNATVRAFLGTRIGCAQCHNHRFDKWTQKEFYESSAFFNGISFGQDYPNQVLSVMRTHVKEFQKDEAIKSRLSSYSRMLFSPSRALVRYNANRRLTYPSNYAYTNAKPNETVKERIVFGYGDKALESDDRRKVFATWLTSKNNPMFARIMANRLWKRIMGISLMEPIDDWKDNITIQNPDLFNALGDTFAKVDYDFKAFLSVIFNSEAYQLGYHPKNVIQQEEYKVQGANLKRMSSTQIIDSLLTLQYGNIDGYMKLDPQYFEFEDKLNATIQSYKEEILPLMKAHYEQYGQQTEEIDSSAIAIMSKYFDKLQELEEYYQIEKNGRLKNNSQLVAMNKTKSKSKEEPMMMQGSMSHNKGKAVMASHYQNNDFMKTFGATARSAPETNVNTGATIKQILKLMNSDQSKNAVKKDSFLMREMWKIEKLPSRISYLYHSIYGRAPSKKDVAIAAKFLGGTNKMERWSKYALALINSPEFYFYK